MSRRIAIVEDEPAIRANYADALRRHGYEVATYANRADALAAFRTRLPDLALVDIGLGDDIDGGFALTRELRALSATLPIIFLSARDSDFDIVAGLAPGRRRLPDQGREPAASGRAHRRAVPPQRAARRAARRATTSSSADRSRSTCSASPRTGTAQRVDLTLTEFWMVHALARFPGPRQGSRCADARRQHRRRRQHDHVAREAHPPQVPGGRSRRSTTSPPSTAWAIAGTRNEGPPHRAVDSRATAARPHGVPGAAVARRFVRARTGARAARRAGAHARRHRAGGGHRAARPAAAVRRRGPTPSRRSRASAPTTRRTAPIASPPSASPEIAQIIDGLSRTTARIWVIDRDGTVLARAGTLKTPRRSAAGRFACERVFAGHDRPPVLAGAGSAERGFHRRRRVGVRAGRTRRRGRARRHPHHRPPPDVRREGGDRQRGAPDLGRRPGARAPWSSRRRATRCSRSATARSSACSTSCWRCCSSARSR